MGTRLACFALGALAVLMLAPAQLSAQHVSISPTVGVYIPTTELVAAANGQEFKQEIGIAVGGRLNLAFGPRFGILTSVSYVPSKLRFTVNQNESKTDANLLFGSARATLYLLPITAPLWLNVNGGASLIHRGGKAFENTEYKNDYGGVVGATVGVHLGSLLSFYVAADDYIYGARLEDATLGLDSKKTQNDVQLAVGLGVPLSGR
jgi:hypothetical protein